MISILNKHILAETHTHKNKKNKYAHACTHTHIQVGIASVMYDGKYNVEKEHELWNKKNLSSNLYLATYVLCQLGKLA